MTARNEFVAYAQARLASLGFDPGPVDGLDGLRTRRAFDAALPAKAQSPQAYTPGTLTERMALEIISHEAIIR